jgi:hypothetical protein
MGIVERSSSRSLSAVEIICLINTDISLAAVPIPKKFNKKVKVPTKEETKGYSRISVLQQQDRGANILMGQTVTA